MSQNNIILSDSASLIRQYLINIHSATAYQNAKTYSNNKKIAIRFNADWFYYYIIESSSTNYKHFIGGLQISNIILLCPLNEYRIRQLKELSPQFFNNKGSSLSKNEPCFHEWKMYWGIRESYEYCTKCDRRKYDEQKN